MEAQKYIILTKIVTTMGKISFPIPFYARPFKNVVQKWQSINKKWNPKYF